MKLRVTLFIIALTSFSINLFCQKEIIESDVSTLFKNAEAYYEKTGLGDSLISTGKAIQKKFPNKYIIDATYHIGSGYLINKNFEKAESYLIESLNDAKKENHKKWLAKIHNRLGALHQNNSKLDKAIYHFLESIKLSKEIVDPKTLALSYYGVSVIYAIQNQPKKQIEYLHLSLKTISKYKEIPALTKNIIYGSTSQQYASIGANKEYNSYKDSTLIYAKKALRIAKENELNQRIPSDLNYIGLHYINKGLYDEGLTYIKGSLEYSKYMKPEAKLNAFQILAHIHRAKKQKDLCYTYLDSINKLPIKQQAYYGSIISKYSYVSYKYFKDFDKAFASLDEYFEFEKQKQILKQNKTINELETKHRTEIKDAKIKQLTFYLIVSISVLLLIILLFLFFRLQKSKKSNLALKEAIKQQLKLEKELVNVRNNIAQDFHDDLGNKLARISFLSRLVEDELSDADANIKSKVTQVKDDTVSLYVGTKDFIFSLKPNSDYLEEVVTYLSDFGEDYFSETEIQFILDKKINLNKKLPHYWSKQLIYIFKEAMTNAFKYANCTKLILKFESTVNELRISCIDNGIGISKENLSSKNGLYNMKKRAEKINGSLEIVTSEKDGTVITFIGKLNK